ncbi:hypothetical protein Esi_0049_0108 [Ectocarpus siliculosus]|uniref:Uncharacterized protein n=1 Tax=Ectocarpus siliculosus TaxID=2880 RepID=D7G2Z5_ECTSI|nr:hypothetical protein Esi_0049_0108 [Ectocarpus siliculosus]|eukprot:CBJ48852.1 hypothetical protein Esi_0049_0108 [Ectocarpus siliculosus]
MKPTTLHPPGSTPTVFPGLTTTDGGRGGGGASPLAMSLGFRLRNHPHLRRFHGDGSGGGEATNSFLDNVREAIVDKAREVRDAIGTKKYDELTLFKRKGQPTVHVPTGRVVAERAWAELDARRTVRFSPRIGAVLVPTRKETFPKPADVAASFVTAEERAGAEKEISPTGSGRSEWQALLLETRHEARERQETQAQLQRERDQEEEQRHECQQPRKLAQKERPRNVFEALFLQRRNTANSNDEVDGPRHGGFGVRRPLGEGRKKVHHVSDPSLVGSNAEGRTAG